MFATPCPACATAMRAIPLDRLPQGQASIDLCDTCRGLWFDDHESTQLTPGATLALLREVAAPAKEAARPLPANLPCPRCSGPLAETQDLQKTTRFRYWRCGRGHGRYTPYLQFLLEKNFIRPLSPREFAQLKAQVKTIRCSGCGAPVDLERNAACGYCGAPIVALDNGALSRAVRQLDAAERARTTIDVDRLADALLMTEQAAQEERSRAIEGSDLVAAGLAAVGALLFRG